MRMTDGVTVTSRRGLLVCGTRCPFRATTSRRGNELVIAAGPVVTVWALTHRGARRKALRATATAPRPTSPRVIP